MGYSKKATKGIGWVSFLQVSSKLLTLFKYVFIARILSPLELGVFGIAILVVSFFDSFTETGISAFLVQTSENEEKFVSSTWLVSIVRGLLLFLLIIVFAYPISLFFNAAYAYPVIVLSGFLPLIRGFINPATAKFQKHLDFNKEYFYRISILFFDFLAAVFLLLIYRNSFGLVLALIFSAAFEVAVSLLFVKPRPKLIIEKNKIREIFSFGKWITILSSLSYLAQQLDSIAVGKLLGVQSLGIYQLAQKFSLQIMVDLGGVFSRVAFPLFAKIKDDNLRTKRALMKILQVGLLIFGATATFLFIFSREVLYFFAGSKWLEADNPLKIFSITGLIIAFMAVITALFLARGRQDITVKITVYRVIIMALFIVPATIWLGVIGTSLISLLAYAAILPLAFFELKRIISKK